MLRVFVFLSGLLIFASSVHGQSVDHRLTSDMSASDSRIFESNMTLGLQLETDLSSTMFAYANTAFLIDIANDIESDKVPIQVPEVWVETELKRSKVRFGKQLALWSQMDNLPGLEYINPRNFHEFHAFNYVDSGLGQWSVSAESQSRIGNVSVVLVPASKTHQFPTGDDWYALRAPRFQYGFEVDENQSDITIYEDDEVHGLAAVRFEGFEDQWQWSLMSRIGPDFEPVATNRLDDDNLPALSLSHETLFSIGTSASASLNGWVLRGEAKLNPSRTFNRNENGALSKTEANQLILAVGADAWTYFDTFVSFQMMLDQVFAKQSALVRPTKDTLITITARRSFLRDQLSAEFSLYATGENDNLVKASLANFINDDVEIKFGADVYSGSMSTVFGQYDERDRIWVSAQYSF